MYVSKRRVFQMERMSNVLRWEQAGSFKEQQRAGVTKWSVGAGDVGGEEAGEGKGAIYLVFSLKRRPAVLWRGCPMERTRLGTVFIR